MTAAPETRYATTEDGVSIAYQTVGDGPVDLRPRARELGRTSSHVASAGPSEVLVSCTVKDLTAGSGLSFEDRGEHALTGVPDRRQLYRVLA